MNGRFGARFFAETNRLVRECLVGLAMRKKGITEEHYLSPLTVDDARD